MENVDSAKDHGLFFTRNGKPVRHLKGAAVENPVRFQFTATELAEGDWLQLIIVNGLASPAYEYSPKGGR